MPESDPAVLLQRVLLLERQQGFQNRAAMGGLSEFSQRQVLRLGPARHAGLHAAAQILQEYGDKDRRSRESAVSDALRALLTGVERPSPPTGPTSYAGQSEPLDSRKKPEQRAPSRRQAKPSPKLHLVHQANELEQPATIIRGVGTSVGQALARLGVGTVRDLLYFFPRIHYDYTDTRSISRLRLGQKTTLVGTVASVRNNRTPRGIVITTAAITDDTGVVAVRWFNQPYLSERLPIGARIAITGEPDIFNGQITFSPRDYELLESGDPTHAGRLVPVYPLTKGLYQRSLRQLIRRVVEEYGPALPEFLPADFLERLQLPDLPEAVRQYHFPADEKWRSWAEQRLAFDELLLVQLGLLQRKRSWQQPIPGISIPRDDELLSKYSDSLPFDMTGAQRRVTLEILDDMARSTPMSRLLQGDVGSGKTVVAAAALLHTVRSGKQGVMMAPTEILAEQHYRTVRSLLEPFGVCTALLIGSTPKAQKRSIYEMARDGQVNVVVGTHALIQEDVALHAMGLAITDEQHRFGVEQRSLLRQKGLHPHTLAMTATPIPRTLAMTIYGDLDVSSIDEMPPGRKPVITTWSRTPAEAYGVVRDEVRRGHQAFVICPVIEESADSDMRSVVAEHRELQRLTFSDLKVGLLHGRMKPTQKEATLDSFRNGEFHILVATSVVEVGIDIPNATVMVIRDAHRFGLAQLHQFRGRVGRGGDQAFCVLLSPSEGEGARERLEALTATENGFELAEEDLRLRGPGEFWGTRQSGLPELRVAQLGDLPTIELARRAALDVLERDPDLSQSEHSLLRAEVKRFWTESADLS